MHHGEISTEVARGLKVLGERIKEAKIPPSKLDETLNVATWNVRELGKKRRQGASLHYIAEVMGQFDLVSVVELRDDVRDLSEIMRYLGPYWDVVYSDYITDGGGNRERIGYVFDRRAVTFTGLASHTHTERKKSGTEYRAEIDWWRPPYMASFRAGNFDFILLAAHVRWGDGEKERAPELSLLAEWVDKRVREKWVDEKDIIVLGDFNIPDLKGPLYQAVSKHGLKMAAALTGTHGTNLAKDKRYDQILHHEAFTKAFTDVGGSLDFYRGDHSVLYPGQTLSKEAFTYEMSDHLPLWVQLNTDNDAEQLECLLNPKGR
jgi:hypothetical protein